MLAHMGWGGQGSTVGSAANGTAVTFLTPGGSYSGDIWVSRSRGLLRCLVCSSSPGSEEGLFKARTRCMILEDTRIRSTNMYCGAAMAGLCLACQAAESCRRLARGPAGEADPVPKEIMAGARRKPKDGQDEVAGRVLGNRPRAHRTSSSASFANGGPGSRALGIPRVGFCLHGTWIPGRSWVLIWG